MKIEDLPEKYQGQAREKLYGDTSDKRKNKPQRAKYNNAKETVGNLKFDSKKEAERFEELMIMQQAGLIKGLKLQHNFTLREGYTLPCGERVQGTVYKADFTYYDTDGTFHIEDVKGVPTDIYKLKKKMMLDKGWRIEET